MLFDNRSFPPATIPPPRAAELPETVLREISKLAGEVIKTPPPWPTAEFPEIVLARMRDGRKPMITPPPFEAILPDTVERSRRRAPRTALTPPPGESTLPLSRIVESLMLIAPVPLAIPPVALEWISERVTSTRLLKSARTT